MLQAHPSRLLASLKDGLPTTWKDDFYSEAAHEQATVVEKKTGPTAGKENGAQVPVVALSPSSLTSSYIYRSNEVDTTNDTHYAT